MRILDEQWAIFGSAFYAETSLLLFGAILGG